MRSALIVCIVFTFRVHLASEPSYTITFIAASSPAPTHRRHDTPHHAPHDTHIRTHVYARRSSVVSPQQLVSTRGCSHHTRVVEQNRSALSAACTSAAAFTCGRPGSELVHVTATTTVTTRITTTISIDLHSFPTQPLRR